MLCLFMIGCGPGSNENAQLKRTIAKRDSIHAQISSLQKVLRDLDNEISTLDTANRKFKRAKYRIDGF